jgi:hypothetical protein
MDSFAFHSSNHSYLQVVFFLRTYLCIHFWSQHTSILDYEHEIAQIWSRTHGIG